MLQEGVLGQSHQITQVGSHGFQTGVCTHTRDHESNWKLQRHICAYWLMGGRQLNHPEKDCNFKKQAKNDQAAAHH